MKTIDAYWEEILRLNCSCLGGRDFIEIHRDKSFLDNSDNVVYYIKFIDEAMWDFKTRLRTLKEYRKYWKEFIDGNHQTHNGIYLDINQLSELYSILYDDAATHEIIVKEDMDAIDNFVINKFEKYPWSDRPDESFYSIILFKSEEGFVFSAEMNNNILHDFGFSWALDPKITKKEINKYTTKFLFDPKCKYPCQENELFLTKNDTVQFLSTINYCLKNTVIKEDRCLLEL